MLLNTQQFMWHKDTATFTAEASSLGFRQIPQEFDLQSQRTGRLVRVEGVRVDRDREGDAQAWVYKPKGGNLHFTVTVFND